MKDDDTNCTTTVSKNLRVLLEKQAAFEDMTLSKYIAKVLSQHATGELIITQPMKVRTMDNRGRIKLPAALIEAFDLQPTTPLAIFPFHRGALIRPVR